jgi:hypothetical protein
MHHIYSGVRLEQGPIELSNNSLVLLDNVGEAERALVCSTDRKDNESNDHGNWFLPNGSRIDSTANDFQTLYVSILEYQAIGLNRVNNSKIEEIQTGVYRCEMMDRENIIHSLFVGIYPENEGKQS